MKKFPFTYEHYLYIVENVGQESIKSMCEKFKCSSDDIYVLLKDVRLEKPQPVFIKWSEEELNLLRSLGPTHTAKEMAKLLPGRSANAIYEKAGAENITLRNMYWTAKEDSKLTEFWGTISIESLAKKMNRSVSALKTRAFTLKLGAMIDNATEVLKLSEVCDILQVDRSKVIRTWVPLGLNLKKRRVSKKQTYRVVVLDDLIEFLKSHQDLWDSRLVEPYMLGLEEEWLIEKRKQDRKNPPSLFENWSKDQKLMAKSLVAIGVSYKNIGKKVGRTETAVTKQLNHAKIRPLRFWTNEELECLKANCTDSYADINIKLTAINPKVKRTCNAIRIKLRELGIIQQRATNEWSNEEDSYLRDNYKSQTSEVLCEHLPKRTLASIRARASLLGIGKKSWTEEEVAYLKANYGVQSLAELNNELSGRTARAIHAKAEREGFKVKASFEPKIVKYLYEHTQLKPEAQRNTLFDETTVQSQNFFVAKEEASISIAK